MFKKLTYYMLTYPVSTSNTFVLWFSTYRSISLISWARLTWKQVRRAWGKSSKVLLFVCVSSKLNLPPKSCIPSRAKIMRKRKSNSNRDAMDFIEFNRDATKLERAVQCLWDVKIKAHQSIRILFNPKGKAQQHKRVEFDTGVIYQYYYTAKNLVS